MSDIFYQDNEERRKFPRIKAQCPVNYFTHTTGNWTEARLEDYSAGGVCFVCNETFQQNSVLTIQVIHGAHKDIPPIAASAVVVRCESNEDNQYRVACKFNRVQDMNPKKMNRFNQFSVGR